MKKIAIIFTICLMEFSVYSQDTAKVKSYRNEFGIDATGFLKSYLNIGASQQYPEYYNPSYYLTYRRHFDCGNLRVAIGGDYTYNQVPSDMGGDTNLNYDHSYSINASVGWEFYSNLSKKWQVYYGADIRLGTAHSNSDATNQSGNGIQGYYEVGQTSTTTGYAFAPFLGIRFKLTKRLSILTEASYAINWVKYSNSTFYVSEPGFIGTLPSSTSQSYKQEFTSFSQPLSVFVDFAL